MLNLGCITRSWLIPNHDTSVVLGYADPRSYLNNPMYMGAIVGRVANRIGGASFSLNGAHHTLEANEGNNTLHGGQHGLHTRIWDMRIHSPQSAIFKLSSPHGDEGFPGKVEFTIEVTLSGATLTYDMRATVDRPTPINLAQHSYYSLGGVQNDHRLHIPARAITQTDAGNIPTGQYAGVADTRFDFSSTRRLGDADPAGAGYDANYVLNGPTISATSPTGLRLTMETDQPGLQFYSARGLSEVHAPLPNQSHGPCAGFCFEPQGFPDALNQPDFPSIIATPDTPYRQRLAVTIQKDT